MALNNRMPYDSSDSEDDAWELVCDDTVPLAASPSQVDATAVPDSFIGDVVESNAFRSHQIESGASSGLENSGDESFATAVSTITDGGHRSSDAKEGEDDANVEEGNHSLAPTKEEKVTTGKLLDLPLEEEDDDAKTEEGVDTLALVEEQESPTGKLLNLPEKLLGSGSWFDRATAKVADEDVGEEMQAHYDDKLKRWVFPGDDLALATESPAPTLEIPRMMEAPDTTAVPTPSAPTEALLGKSDNEKSEESLSSVDFNKEQGEKTVTSADSEEKKEEPESSGFVESLSNMGFQREQIEKAMRNLRDAGVTEIDYDSVVGKMAGEDSPESTNLLKSTGGEGAIDAPDEAARMNDLRAILPDTSDEELRDILRDNDRASCLRGSVAKEIDEYPILGEANGENSDGDRRPWNVLESSIGEFDERNELLRRRTQTIARNVGLSARELWSNVRDESERFREDLRARVNEADFQEQTARAATRAKYAAASAKDSICRANKEYGITDKLATAAVVGGATLLALGNPRAGVGVIAVAGASLAAGEAMKQSSARSSSTYTRDYGLGEGLHLD